MNLFKRSTVSLTFLIGFSISSCASGFLFNSSRGNGLNLFNSFRGPSNLNFRSINPFRRRRNRRDEFSTINLITKNGYPSEIHEVFTEDGYILELHRIPFGPESPTGSRKMPVIIQHGNFQSSTDWMLNKPANNCLPLLLADKGYDVWLGNQRGNTYSKSHVRYRRTNPRFWDYSYHEVALYDVPAVIDYILLKTNSSKVHYISHSIGSKNFIAGMSLRPEYNKKIGIGITMGPSGYMSHMFNGYARLLAPILKAGERLMNIMGPFPVISHTVANIMRSAMPQICNPRVDLIGVCSAFFFSLTGQDRDQITPEKIADINAVFPSPSSYKVWIHLLQETQSGHFRQYDYRFDGNMRMYGQPNPPDYDLSLVTAPISILHGESDHFSRIEDTDALAKQLPNLVDFYVVPWKNWTHMDFNYAKDAKTLCYDHVVEMLQKYDFQ